MPAFTYRLFDALDDALAATIELHRLGIHARDIQVFSTSAATEFETARLDAPHLGVDGNRADDPLRVQPLHIASNNSTALIKTLAVNGASFEQAQELAQGVEKGKALIAVRSNSQLVDVATALDQFEERKQATARGSAGGWQSIPDDEFHSPAADNRPAKT